MFFPWLLSKEKDLIDIVAIYFSMSIHLTSVSPFIHLIIVST